MSICGIRGIKCLSIKSPLHTKILSHLSRMAAEKRGKAVRILGLEPKIATIAKASPQNKESTKPKSPAQQQTKKVFPPPSTIPLGTVPEDTSIWDNAVLLIDKPKGWTSFDVCGKLRGLLAGLLHRRGKDIKVGHAGTLDPMATGLLIVCVGQGTKSIEKFMDMTKEYSGTFRLGEGTASYDAESDVSERLPWEDITDETIHEARNSFLGDIEQIPPMFSAIKVNGKRLYESARAGKEVERKARSVTVTKFDIERAVGNRQDFDFYIVCSKGTYIRSLAHDIGQKVGSAAHLTALRREAIGEHNVRNAWSMETLIEQLQAQRNEKRVVAASPSSPSSLPVDTDEQNGAPIMKGEENKSSPNEKKRLKISSDDEYSE